MSMPTCHRLLAFAVVEQCLWSVHLPDFVRGDSRFSYHRPEPAVVAASSVALPSRSPLALVAVHVRLGSRRLARSGTRDASVRSVSAGTTKVRIGPLRTDSRSAFAVLTPRTLPCGALSSS